MSCEWSSGQVEGQVTRLKLVKWSMYGRASFPLLQQREARSRQLIYACETGRQRALSDGVLVACERGSGAGGRRGGRRHQGCRRAHFSMPNTHYQGRGIRRRPTQQLLICPTPPSLSVRCGKQRPLDLPLPFHHTLPADPRQQESRTVPHARWHDNGARVAERPARSRFCQL